MRDFIYVYMKEPEVHVLGPGTRYGLWVQGCNKNCAGCIAKDAHDMQQGTKINMDALALEIAFSNAEGITISGGEPFLQAEELATLLEKIKKKRNMGVIVYTGYTYEELLQKPDAKNLLSKIDLLIDGPYIKELDDGKSLRGSANQRVLPLTDRYHEYLKDYGVGGRKQEIFSHGIFIHEIGIPSNNEKSLA